MSYKIELDYSPVYELVCSLSIYTSKKFIKNIDLGKDWIVEVGEKLNPAFANDLEKTKEIPCMSLLNLLIWQSPEKGDIPSFIVWLNSLSPGELYEKLSPHVVDGLPSDLDKLRDHYIYLLTNWYEQYFKHIDPKILRGMEDDVMRNKELIESMDPIDFVEQASGGIRIEPMPDLQLALLVPTVHFSPLNTYCQLKNMFIVQYSVDLPNDNPKDPPKGLSRITSALGDDNRMRILKFLAKEPRTFNEIMQFSSLSKTTVHHHMMVLRGSGLVSAYIDECCKADQFSLRPSAFAELNTFLENFLEVEKLFEDKTLCR